MLEGPALARYRVLYAEVFVAAPPEEADLRVPPAERPVMDRLVDALGLKAVSPAQAQARLQALFEREFHYSLRLQAPTGGKGALAHFFIAEPCRPL